MTVTQMTETLGLTVFCTPDPDRVVSDGYVGDLLSWVMGRAQENQAWLTVMSNQNVAAVAALADVSCVILAEGVKPDDDLLKKAQTQGINLLGTKLTSFQAAVELTKLFQG